MDIKDAVKEIFDPYLNPMGYRDVCGMTGKPVPPEDMCGCNNAEGCDNCPHNDEED